jgi:hypothetical protein
MWGHPKLVTEQETWEPVGEKAQGTPEKIGPSFLSLEGLQGPLRLVCCHHLALTSSSVTPDRT